ncbi:hypothetical protein FACS1894145_7780 [Bacteroidia bacterium]|nr:hypothetical protein FACS1894145_7780 [Bacteroidia bacterium]
MERCVAVFPSYAKPFETDPNEKRKIVKIGVVFDTATRNIKEWKTA